MAQLLAVDTWPHRAFTGHCPRCGSPRQMEDGTVDNTAGYLCRECLAESWHKAESYGGDYSEIQARAWKYQNEWRSLDLNRLKSTLMQEVKHAPQ